MTRKFTWKKAGNGNYLMQWYEDSVEVHKEFVTAEQMFKFHTRAKEEGFVEVQKFGKLYAYERVR